MNTLALYFHIPFCHNKKCDYCSFVSYCKDNYEQKVYVDALLKEIALRGEDVGKRYKISSIYFGGGTPSMLEDGVFTNIMIQIKKYFRLLNNCEITIEVNPDSVTESKLREYLLVGINRLSIGIQTLNADILKVIGRQHSSQQAKKAVALAKKVGFKNISIDMMIGLPYQTLSDVKKMAKFALKSKVQHVSCYSLILEDGTPLADKIRAGVMSVPSEDDTVEMYNYCLHTFEKAGVKRYEVSNFAKEDYESKHNMTYWTMGEYLAFGLAGHSYMNDTRFANISDFDKYIESINNDTLPIVSVEKLSLKKRKEEAVMLSLRTKEGIDIESFDYKFGGHLLRDKKKEIDFLHLHGFITIKKGHLCVSDNAYYVLNSIILKLI